MSPEFEGMPRRRYGEFLSGNPEDQWNRAERHLLVPVKSSFDEICEIAKSKDCQLVVVPVRIGQCVGIARQENDRGSSFLLFEYPEEDGSKSVWMIEGQKQVLAECLGIESEDLYRIVPGENIGRETSLRMSRDKGFVGFLNKLVSKRFHRR